MKKNWHENFCQRYPYDWLWLVVGEMVMKTYVDASLWLFQSSFRSLVSAKLREMVQAESHWPRTSLILLNLLLMMTGFSLFTCSTWLSNIPDSQLHLTLLSPLFTPVHITLATFSVLLLICGGVGVLAACRVSRYYTAMVRLVTTIFISAISNVFRLGYIAKLSSCRLVQSNWVSLNLDYFYPLLEKSKISEENLFKLLQLTEIQRNQLKNWIIFDILKINLTNHGSFSK